MVGENWKDICFTDLDGRVWNLIGKYQVSDKGNIRNISNGKIRKPQRNKGGYETVILPIYDKHSVKTQDKGFSIHRLVAFMFIGFPYNIENPQVNHIDENKSNNNLENLEWVSAKDNCNHGTRNKRMGEKHRGNKHTDETKNKISKTKTGAPSKLQGENSPTSKLMNEDVIEIRRLYSGGLKSQRQLAKMYNIGTMTVNAIVNKKTWKNI